MIAGTRRGTIWLAEIIGAASRVGADLGAGPLAAASSAQAVRDALDREHSAFMPAPAQGYSLACGY
jgi:hypothetical protein